MKKAIRLLALLLTLVMIAGMVPAFAVSAEDEAATKGIALEKDSFTVGEDIIVNAVGEGKDWVGLYLASDAEDGSIASIYWYYPAEKASVNIKDTDLNREDLKDIPAGDYKLLMFANDGYEIIAKKEFSVVSATAFEDVNEIVLAEGQGSPFGGHQAGESFAVRYNIGADSRLAGFKSHSLATYSAACHQINYSVYQWDTDYDTTVKGAVLFSYDEMDHADCSSVSIAIPDSLNLTGDLLIVTTCVEAVSGITYWQANEEKADGATYFDNGAQCEAFTFTFVTAKALPDTTTDPYFVLDFGTYEEDADAVFGFQNANGVEWNNTLNSGYVTFKATNGDPYTWITGSKVNDLLKISTRKLAYMVVKYRTDYSGQMEFFVQRADGVNPGQDGSYANTNLTGDRMWHTAIVDASNSWGKADTKLTIFRIDPLAGSSPADHQVDVSYIAFFSNLEAAEAYAAAETKTKAVSGELSYDDEAVLSIGGAFYTSDKILKLTDAGDGKYTDADGNEYTVEGFRVLNAKGIDTGYIVPALDDGRILGVGNLIPLTYQDPADGAVEVDGKKYIYDQKIAVSAVYNSIDPEDRSVISPYADKSGTNLSPDTFFINNKVMQDGAAHDYIANKLGGVIRDTKREYSTVSFRGWAFTPNGDSAIVAYGYSLNDGEIIWNEGWINAPEAGLAAAAGGPNTTRYKIDVDMASLDDGVYNLYLYVKDGVDTYRMSTWGNIKIVKGGEFVLDHYADANGNSYALDSVILTEGDQKYVLTNAKDVTNGLSTGELDYNTVINSYELDLGTNVGTVNNNTADQFNNEGSVWPAAGYTVPGTQLYLLWGANGSVVFNSLPFADYNTVEIVIGSDPGADAFQVGFVTDASQPFGTNQDASNPNMTANLVSALCPAGSEGEPNLSGRGEGAGWNGVERLVRLDISDIDYAGAVSLACGSVAPHTLVFAKVTFINYAEKTVMGKYVYDTELSYVGAPAIPVNPAEVVPVYILDGEGLNVGSDSMRTEDATYDYEKGCVRYTATEGDPNAGSQQIPSGTTIAPFMVLKYRTEVSCHGELFVGTGAGATGGSNVQFPSDYIADGEWHCMIVDLRGSGDYDATTNVINHFRNDYVGGAGQWIEVEYYAFFDSYDKAEYYAEHDMHVLPVEIKTHTATFVKEDGKAIKVLTFKEGDTKLVGVPNPPAKDGYTAAWEEYTLGTEDITIKVVYTAKQTETETATDAPETATDAPETVTDAPETVTDAPETATDAPETVATTAEETTGAEKSGCKSVVAASGVIALLAVAGAAVVLKKKEND